MNAAVERIMVVFLSGQNRAGEVSNGQVRVEKMQDVECD